MRGAGAAEVEEGGEEEVCEEGDEGEEEAGECAKAYGVETEGVGGRGCVGGGFCEARVESRARCRGR